MAKPEIIEKNPITLVELKAELGAIKRRDDELSYRGNKTEEYVNHFAKLTQKAVGEIRKKIEALNVPRMKEHHINKIIDLMPGSVEHLKVIVQGYTITMTNDHMRKIVAILDDYIPKKAKKEEKKE